MSAPRFSPGGYIPVICACIRDHEDPSVIAVPDPTCPRHAPQVRQGNEPTFAIYDETVQAAHDAIRASRALGRLLAWTLVATLALVLFLTPDHHWTGWHWTAGIGNALLALRLAWTGDTP